MKTGGGWRRIVEIIFGTLAGLWTLALLLALVGGATAYQAGTILGRLAICFVIFALVRRSRIKHQQQAAPPVQPLPPTAWPNQAPQYPPAAPTTPMQPPDPRF